MTTREKMIKYRTDYGIDIQTMARQCRISSYLLTILEEGAVTTPKLVPQIAKAYGLTELEAEELMPLHMRPHGGDYEPDRYVESGPLSTKVVGRLPSYLWGMIKSRHGHSPRPVDSTIWDKNTRFLEDN